MITPSGSTPKAYYEAHKNEFTHAKITFTDSNVIFEDDEIEINGIEARQYMNSAIDLTFGTASCVETEIHLLRSNKTETLKWSDEFKLQFGFDNNNNGIDWFDIGYFTGSKPQRTNVDVIQFIAYDRMMKFDVPADDFIDSLDFTTPKTLTQIYSALCTYIGVSSVSGDEIAANMAHSYSKCPVGTGHSCRDILAWIAEAAGCYAIITPAGNVKMIWYTDHTEDFSLKRDDIFAVDISEVDWLYNASLRKKWSDLESEKWKDLESLTWKELEGYYSPTKVNAVKFVYSEEDVGITVPNSLVTTNVYTIVNNPFLYGTTTQETTGYITNIYNRLNAFGVYIPVSLECVGNVFVETGDIVKLEFDDGSFGRLPIFNRTLRYAGYLACLYETTGNLDRVPVDNRKKQSIEFNGKIHILRKSIDELYSEINDPNTGLATKFSQTDARILATAVSTKAAVYYSAVQPTGTAQIPLAENDLWIDTANGNRLYRYNGSAWVDASYDDTSKARLFYQNTAPTGTQADPLRDGDLWIDTANSNKLQSYNATSQQWEDASPDKYTIQSGVEITSDGVEISGGKWVKIKAGTGGAADGIFEVDTANFKVNSTNKLVQSGDWRMTDDGFTGIWKDSNNNDRVISIRKNMNNNTMPDDIKACLGGALMYSLPTGANSDIETFYLTLMYQNTNQSISRPTVSVWRNGYFMFKILRSSVYYWLVQGGGTMPTEWTVDKVFYCDSIGSPDKSGGRVYSGFFENLYIENIEPYTLAEAEGINYPQASVTAGHVGTQKHWFAYAYLYYIYYNTMTQMSSKDIKHNIKALPSVGEKLDKLNPVTFVYNNDPEEKTRHGLVYEDTVDVMPEICANNEGQKSINYIELIPMLLKEIQDLRKRVKELESRF